MVAKKTTNNSTRPELGQDIEPGFLSARAAVTNTSGMSGTPAEGEMALINKLSRSGNVDPATIYRFDCVPSTQQIDSFFTRMDVSSLINYADEAKTGVPVLNSHRSGGYSKTAELPIGRSFTGMVENDPDAAQMQRFVAGAYMLRNNRANGSVNTDDIINAIEAGTVSDISIGFAFSAGTAEKNYTDRTILRCSICGNDFLQSSHWDPGPDDCTHWPGEMYKSEGGRKTELCVLDVVNAHLSEFSTVYNGATPGAVILKAQRAASEGLLDRPMIHRLEDTYRTRLMDYAAFPVIGERKEKPVEVEPTIEVEPETTVELEQNPNAERTDAEMVDKRVLDDAIKEGAKHALAELAKSLMGSRDFSDDELAVFAQVEARLAAGDTNQANSLLMRLMNPQLQESLDGGEYYEAGDRQAGEGDEDDDEEGGNEPPASTTDLISLSLTASERQQFRGLQEENTRLKKEMKRLVPLAKIGEGIWSELITLTTKSYTAAGLGNGEDIRGMLMQLPFDHVRTLLEQYEAIGSKLYINPDGTAGRQTTPADPNSPGFAQGVVRGAIEQANNRHDYGAYKG